MPPHLSDFTNAQLQHLQTTELMRVLSTLAFARGNPAEYYRDRWPNSLHRDIVLQHFEAAPFQKAAVAPGTSSDASWAAPLVVPTLLAGFLPLVRAASVLSTLPVSKAPFNTRVAKQIAGASTAWVGEGLPKPVSKMGFGNVTVPSSKASSIIVVSEELMRLAAPESADQLAADLKNEVAAFTDKEFLGTGAAVVGVHAAGILNGVVPITATASLAADLSTLVSTFFAARPTPFAAWFVLSPAVVAKVAALDAGRNVTVNGGTLFGLPVAISNGAGNNAILVDAPAIFVADNGLQLDISREAAIQMNDAPDAPVTAATVVVSLWQSNEVGVLAERFVSWVVAAANAVQFLPVA